MQISPINTAQRKPLLHIYFTAAKVLKVNEISMKLQSFATHIIRQSGINSYICDYTKTLWPTNGFTTGLILRITICYTINAIMPRQSIS